MKRSKVDFVIVGGGLTGLSAAIMWARHGWNIAVIDKKNFQPLKIIPLSARVLALRKQSQIYLEKIGVWQNLARKTPVWDFEIYDKAANTVLNFSVSEPISTVPCVGTSPLAFIIEQPILWNALLARVHALPNIQLFGGYAIDSVHVMSNKVQIDLNTHVIDGQLLLAADGANSWIRRYFQFKTHRKAYQQSACVCCVRLARSHDSIARQWFGERGPLAFLPLSVPDQAVMIWSLETVACEALRLLMPSEFTRAVQVYTDSDWVSQIESTPLSFPLQHLYAKQYCADRVVLVGDSAHVIHPLAGQGFNLALADLMALERKILLGQESDVPFYATSILRAYERERKCENQGMGYAMTALDQIFKNRSVVLPRGWFLNKLKNNVVLKNWLRRAASGSVACMR